MNPGDLRKIIGVSSRRDEQADYLPLALLLRSGYACFGHYNVTLNQELDSMLVVLNAQLMELKQEQRNRPAVDDFREFLVEVVAAYESDQATELPTREELGKPIPLIALPMSEIALVYPVAHILELLRRASDTKDASVPRLLDFSRSEILAVLRMKLW